MADVIVRQYGKEALVKIVRNPFKFFYLYNEAAKKSGQAPVLSDQATGLIRMLDSKYAKK